MTTSINFFYEDDTPTQLLFSDISIFWKPKLCFEVIFLSFAIEMICVRVTAVAGSPRNPSSQEVVVSVKSCPVSFEDIRAVEIQLLLLLNLI